MLYSDDKERGRPGRTGELDPSRRAAGGSTLTGKLHILRHTFCSRLAARGATAMEIKELASHADLTTTMRYMHLSPSAKREAIKLLDAPVPARFSGNSLATGTKEAVQS